MESSSRPLSLYVHVPFCAGKCRYCDFFSVPLRNGDVAEKIVQETVNQARVFLDALGVDSAETVYVGGGTPSVIPAQGLDRLLDALGGLHPVEWTVEANPESLDQDFMETCARRGVTRLSVGIQSGDDSCLKILGRPGDSEASARAFALLGAWQGDVSLDYICGIPGQHFPDLSRELSLLPGRAVGHVSLYSLTVEEDTELARMIAQRRIVQNPPETDEEIWLQGARLLEGMGYRHYEISNFALPGKECRHNLRYWRLEQYLGVGPGAVSTLPACAIEPLLEAAGAWDGPASGAGHRTGTAVMRLSNPRSLEAFLRGREHLWGIEIEPVGDRDFLMETLLMGLRTEQGIAREDFRRRFGRDFNELFPGMWERWVDDGAAPAGGGALALTAEGRLFLNRRLREVSEAIDRDDLPVMKVQWP